MNRREFLQCASVLFGGLTASQLGFSLTAEQRDYINRYKAKKQSINFFSKEQRLLVDIISDIIIPEDETPGANAAGVTSFIELMASDWMTEQERDIFLTGLNSLQQSAHSQYGQPFEHLSADKQYTMLEALENEASDHAWYKLGNVEREFISDAPFICQIKELTSWGFFTSEVGAKQTLRYDPMPMKFDGDIPLEPEESTWAITVVG